MSELALKLIKEAKEKRLTRLDLGNCGLTELPDELFELVWLEELNIGNFEGGWSWWYQANEWEREPIATNFNQLAQIDVRFRNLNNLKKLFLYRNKKIDNIENIKYLNKLEFLDLSYTSVIDLNPLKKVKNLKTLKFKDTLVESIEVFKYLTNLTSINLSGTKISDFSPLIFFKRLKKLDLSWTKFNNLYNIRHLLAYFKEKFYFNDSEIRHDGYGPYYDDEGRWHREQDGLILVGCTLFFPPKFILETGVTNIIKYIEDFEAKETITNNQTKLIFIGNSRAGKTSLWQFLKDKIYNDKADSTHGIKTEIWDTETLGTEDNQNLAAHIWDFGGQEYYHATHRLFLADNAVYVLVWEKDSNKQGTRLEKFKLDDDPNGEIEEVELEHFPASYWMENIAYFAGKHCPVLIVQNKVDDEAQKANYTEGVSGTSDCFHLSVQNAFGFQQGNLTLKRHDLRFQDFKERLLELLRKNATAFKLVKYYAQVREALEAKARDTEYIAVSELKDIALQFDETPDLENLLAYLKSFTNTVLYFPQNDLLKDRLYLNPTHISRDIYKILNKTVRENNGKFDVVHIQTRLNCDAPEAERFVALMREFDLIFEKEHDSKPIFIAPQYLKEKDKLGINIAVLSKQLKLKPAFYLRFASFVPRSMMSRFIAHNGQFTTDETYWKNGLIYSSKEIDASIKVEYTHETRTFCIDVQNLDIQAVDMQNIVAQFVKLNNSDDKIEISNDGKAYFELRKIYSAYNQNRIEIDNFEGNYTPLSNFDWLTQKHKTKDMIAITLQALKNEANNYISKAKTKEAMDVVATWAHENNQEQLKRDINLLKGQLITLNRQQTLGTLSFQEFMREQAKVNTQLMDLLSTLEEGKNFIDVESKREEIIESKQSSKTPVAKKTILFITSSPNNLSMPNVGRQLKAINDAYGNNEDLYQLKMIGFVLPENLIGEIEKKQPDIIHFFMHNDTTDGLYFENGNGDIIPIEPDDMSSIFEIITESKKIECVVLNACNSYTHVDAIKPFVPNIVYTNDFVPDGVSGGNNDTIASVFTRKFYEQVASGKTYTAALKRTNIDLKLSKMPLVPQNKKKIEEIYTIQTQ